jgi:hypothetical protein
MPHKYKKWPPAGKRNKTADEGLESGAKTTLFHLRHPPNAQHGSACNSWDILLSLEIPGYDAGACRRADVDVAVIGFPELPFSQTAEMFLSFLFNFFKRISPLQCDGARPADSPVD